MYYLCGMKTLRRHIIQILTYVFYVGLHFGLFTEVINPLYIVSPSIPSTGDGYSYSRVIINRTQFDFYIFEAGL